MSDSTSNNVSEILKSMKNVKIVEPTEHYFKSPKFNFDLDSLIPKYENTVQGKLDKQFELMNTQNSKLIEQIELMKIQNENLIEQNSYLKKESESNEIEAKKK